MVYMLLCFMRGFLAALLFGTPQINPKKLEVALLKRHRDSTEAELRKTRSEMQMQQAQRAQLQSEEELAHRRLQEEVRQEMG